MTDVPLGSAGLIRLLTWLSPAFPVGGFTYSHGLEWAMEDGTVTDAATLSAWIAGVIEHGSGRSDAILLANAWRAATAFEHDTLFAVAELGHALAPTKERRLEAGAQGRAFADTVEKTAGAPTLARLAARLRPMPVVYAVAVGTAAADHEVPLQPAAEAVLHAFAANLVSVAVRALPLGQTDGLRVLAAQEPLVRRVAADAVTQPLGAIGGAMLRADIASMKHETQYTRLFRS
jgi:urease accessory protein